MYRRFKRGRSYKRSGKARYAGKVARVKAKRTFRSAIRMPKRKLAKMYATKVGQVTWKTIVSKRKGRRFGRRFRRRR